MGDVQESGPWVGGGNLPQDCFGACGFPCLEKGFTTYDAPPYSLLLPSTHDPAPRR